jgi:murein DD-endopeptidase MepM/ murein hydrolase activator NlpD
VIAEYAAIPIRDLPLHKASASDGLTVVSKGKLERGQTVGAALRGQGVSAAAVHLITSELRGVFDFRRAHPGDRYWLVQDVAGGVVDFRFSVGSEESVHLLRDFGGSYLARREEVELTPRLTSLAGVIHTSLYDAIRGQGEDPQLANDFAAIFAWDIDFTRSVRPGDDFRIVYERLYSKDHDGSEIFVRTGRILAARFRGNSARHTAVYYETQRGRGSYFRPDGTSVEREFLIAPLEYSRISSNYSSARLHPILNVTRPHHGIDYAAAEGSPLWAVADGTVVHRGWAGGFGNLVKVRHANGFVSYYAHLSRFAKGLRVGHQVHQKQNIGYVGSTGLATGPHVCFRIARNGRYIDPRTIESPAGHPVPDQNWRAFEVERDSLLAHLETGTLNATEEAL